jgi:Ca-activated chloride channel family protein
MPRVALAFLGLVIALAARPLGATAPPQPTFRSASSELVVLPVIVTDKNGRLISGLPRDRFVVYDRERAQPLVHFTNEDTPVSIALAIDNSGSMLGKMGQVVAATLGFARWSNPEDELFVLEFNDRVRDALEHRSLSAGDQDALHAALRTLKPQGRTALNDALISALEHLDNAAHERKVLVLVSDGGDNASAAKLDQVLERARASSVTIYTIGLFDDGAADTNPGVLEELAEATGGERFLPKSPGPLLQACERIARNIRAGYTLAYEPPERDGAFHDVRVAVSGAGGERLTVRTRPGYLAAAGGSQ